MTPPIGATGNGLEPSQWASRRQSPTCRPRTQRGRDQSSRSPFGVEGRKRHTSEQETGGPPPRAWGRPCQETAEWAVASRPPMALEDHPHAEADEPLAEARAAGDLAEGRAGRRRRSGCRSAGGWSALKASARSSTYDPAAEPQPLHERGVEVPEAGAADRAVARHVAPGVLRRAPRRPTCRSTAGPGRCRRRPRASPLTFGRCVLPGAPQRGARRP